MYKPFASEPEKNTEKSPHPRPWVSEQQDPRVYMWASSIPEKWFKIKGQTAFQHVSETGQNRDTMDFLRNNQKYISAIADPKTKTPSNVSANTSKLPSRASSPVQLGKKDYGVNCDGLEPNELGAQQVECRKSGEYQHVLNFAIPENGKKLVMSSSLKNFEMEIPGARSGFLINRYSLPKLLVKPQVSVKSRTGANFKNKKVNQFLNRFENHNPPISFERERKGLNGWKLVAFKKKF